MTDVPRETLSENVTAQSEPDPAVPDKEQQTPQPPAHSWPVAIQALRDALRLSPDDVIPAPRTTRTLAVANQKGGVAKTTTAVNLAAALAVLGREVLVVDMDPQGNASSALGVEHSAGTPGTYEVLVAGKSIADTLMVVPDLPNLTVVPATVDLAGADIELVSQVARETRLRKAISEHIAERRDSGRPLDFVIVDCPPSLGLLTVNALVANAEVLIPLQSEYYALEGLTHLLSTVDLIRQHLNPELHIAAILLTMFDGRTRLAPQVAEEVRQHFPDKLMTTVVPRSVRISEAPSYGQTVLQHDPNSVGARAYLAVARELSARALVEGEATELQPEQSTITPDPGPASGVDQGVTQ